jgi:hypothetical protein
MFEFDVDFSPTYTTFSHFKKTIDGFHSRMMRRTFPAKRKFVGRSGSVSSETSPNSDSEVYTNSSHSYNAILCHTHNPTRHLNIDLLGQFIGTREATRVTQPNQTSEY